VYISRIHAAADEYPNNTLNASQYYWILNNYGNNSTFDPLVVANFEDCGDITAADETDPSTFKLYQRPDNAHGATWGAALATPTQAGAATSLVTFGSGSSNIAMSGQLVLTNEGGTSFQNSPAPVEENGLDAWLLVYPNPVSDKASLNVQTSEQGQVMLTVFDQAGRKVHESNFTGSTQMSVSAWATGVYTYRVQSAERLQFGKVIVQ